MKQLLDGYPVIIEIPIAWGEMDAFQHVNNIVYFRYFESVRIVYFNRIKFIDYMDETGVGPILASTSCKYKLPLRYPDKISVGAKTEKLEDDRFEMHYLLVSHSQQKVAAEGGGLVVAYDYRQNHKVAIPEQIRNNIIELENF